MSEPKTAARTATEVIPGLFHYKIDDERIKTQSDAYALVQEGKVVLIDPLPLEPSQLARLGKVEAIVIGASSHQRSAWRYRRELKAKVYAPEASDGLEEKPDVTFKEGDRLPGGIKPLHAPGPGDAHYAFHLDRKPGVLLCSDLWIRTRKDVEFLPDNYMTDPVRARSSARKLLEIDFDIACFGHGGPITKGARQALADLVRKDAAARKKK